MPLPAMYGELAGWFHLLTAPGEYAVEAESFLAAMRAHIDGHLGTVLELGSGGGNNAVHMSEHVEMTLSDLSPEMLELSKKINPHLEHIVGDMRTLDLGRTFDAVFVHDAVTYMTTLADLENLGATLTRHCRPGGVAIVVPDHTAENWTEGVDDGGHDGPERSLRYFSWSWDPDPSDDQVVTDYVIMTREGSQPVKVTHDTHIEGNFPQSAWLAMLDGAGFDPVVVDAIEWPDGPEDHKMFLGIRRAEKVT